MFICVDCGAVFDEPSSYSESRPYGEGYAYESFACCPCCKGDFEEAVQCASCEEYFSKDDMNGEMCEECVKDAQERIANAIVDMFYEHEYKAFPEDMFEEKFWEALESAFNKVKEGF